MYSDKTDETLPWMEKYRPKTLNEIISNNHVIDTIKKYTEKKFIPHMLFYGPPGTGKTSTITACAREIYGDNFDVMVLEINASEERGIEIIRNKVKDFISSKSLFFGMIDDIFKLVILDEADSMTGDAQSMLRRLIEDNTLNARFCLLCNNVKNIDPAIQSRCTTFRFGLLNDEDIKGKIKYVAECEKVKVTEDGISTIIKIAKGDMRKVLNYLQSTSMAYPVVNGNNVSICMGYPKMKDIEEIYKILMKDSCSDATNKINKIKKDNGYSLLEITTEVHSYLIKKFLADDKMPSSNIIDILRNIKNIEINLMSCPNEEVQLAGFVSVFVLNRK